jgi:hypothetical protein
MAVGSNGYRAALASRQRTPGLISSSSGTAGLPPFISFSTSYPELPPMRNCMARRRQGAGVELIVVHAAVLVLLDRKDKPA